MKDVTLSGDSIQFMNQHFINMRNEKSLVHGNLVHSLRIDDDKTKTRRISYLKQDQSIELLRHLPNLKELDLEFSGFLRESIRNIRKTH
jgi:hypothetical protein